MIIKNKMITTDFLLKIRILKKSFDQIVYEFTMAFFIYNLK